MYESYSQGILAPHVFPLRRVPTDEGYEYVDVPTDPLSDTDESLIEERSASSDASLDELPSTSIRADVRRYWSFPDVEGIISATNALQSDHGLSDFMSQFKDNIYRDGDIVSSIKAAKITYPHIDHVRRHDIPAPHPSMSDEELMKYLWPSSSLNRENRSYIASLWIDIGDEDEDFEDQDDEFGTWRSKVTSRTFWRRIVDLPIQVGSNRCNLSVMRSYLGDETWDDEHEITWGERARRFLEDNLRWEPLIPDGYFVIKGKMKRINVSDKLMMNMSYVVKQSTSTEYGTKKLKPIRERAVEVRSVRSDLGLAYLRIILEAPSRLELKPGKGMNNEIFKFYNSTLRVMIDKEFEGPVNLFDLVRGYGVIVMSMTDTAQPMNDLLEAIRLYSSNDRDIIRLSMVTMAKAGTLGVKDVIDSYRYHLLRSQNDSVDSSTSNQDLISKLRKKVLPHCDSDDLLQGYQSKIRFLAMMVVDLGLAVTTKVGSREYRKDPTDRKDFAYKRWESAGHRMRDYIRSMLVPRSHMEGKKDNRTRVYGTIDITRMVKSANQLIDFMNRNQWPSRYRIGGVYKTRKDEYKDGIIDDVPKYNLVSMVDSYRTVKISAKGGPNTSDIRRVHTSQWGQQCPANTPENANIGLNNNMSEPCLITNDLSTDEKSILRDLIDSFERQTTGYLLMLDGNPLGYYNADVYDDLIRARRKGKINRSIGIARHHLWSKELSPGIPVIVVRTSHGRPIFPAFIIDQSMKKTNEILSMTREGLIQNTEREGYRDIMEYLLSKGFVEFIDAYELVYNVVVAPWIESVREHQGPIPYTHAMIKPGHILSQATNCLSFIEHNPAARGTYGTQHVKQAIGRPFLHPEDRYDHETNYLFNPEPPLVMTDTMRRLLYPPVQYQPEKGIDPRDVGIGRNVNIICMSYDGNNDDGLIVSQSMVDSGIFDGEHFSITTSDKSILPSSIDIYEWMISDLTNREIRDERGQGIPDPDYSGSIVTPYGDPYIVEVPEDIYETLTPISLPGTQSRGYELRPGEIYVLYGFYSPYIIQYRDNISGVITEGISLPGEQPLNLPGKTIIGREKGQIFRRMALTSIRSDLIDEFRERSLNREHRPLLMSYDDLQTNPGIIDTRYIIEKTDDDITSYAMGIVPIPRTLFPGTAVPTRQGIPVAIRPRRSITRGDVAIKLMKRRGISSESEVIDPHGEKERFEITHGVVDGIERGTPLKIRSTMPIGPKPGNKYAALYAQKSVIARVAPDNEMPKARWYNNVTERWEEMTFDVVFNPLSFPSRMTIGMEYEIFISGTLRYLYDIETSDGSTLGDIYRLDRERFNSLMEELYQVNNAADLIDELSDSTGFVYDNKQKRVKCENLRASLGIPVSGLYDVYLRDETDTGEWTRKIDSQIVCGTVYYVALRHLVDNKRRARGYVGRKDPLTLQPVKGRRRNGGANTGTMETDAYKAHGAAGMLLERLSRVSDYKQFLKCSICNGLVSRIGTNNTLKCNDCQAVLQPQEAIEHDTVNSWNLFRHYIRALGVEIYESFN